MDLSQRFTMPKILGGSEKIPLQYHSHHVGISADGKYICGGTILTATFILTAAHCLINRKLDRLRVIAGSPIRGSVFLSTQSREVEAYFIKDYDAETHENDIALLALTENLKFNTFVTNIEYPKAATVYDGKFKDYEAVNCRAIKNGQI